MTSLANQIVLITGASSGIGEACARLLAPTGAKLLLIARRIDRLDALAAELAAEHQTPCLTRALDVRHRPAVLETLINLPDEWAAIDVLINNAGLSRGLDRLHEADIEDWEEMIDTNLKGLLYLTRQVVPGMVARGRGHVVNMASIAGLAAYPGGSVYCASKAAVRVLSDGLRQDLLGTPVRVTTLSPGMTETEFSQVRFHGDSERAATVYQGMAPLTGIDVAEVILFCLTRPAHVAISEVVLMPTAQASATLVQRSPGG